MANMRKCGKIMVLPDSTIDDIEGHLRFGYC